MKQFFGKKSRSALAMVLMVSLGLHIIAIIVFGTINFVSEALREETVFQATPVVPPPQKEPEYTVNIQQRNQSTPPPRPPAIVVNNPSELDIPALDINVNVDSSSVYGRGGGGFGGGLAGIREMTISGNLFGVSINAKKLGVILDVSSTAHRTLGRALEEIEKNFPQAEMILMVGCGMSEIKRPKGRPEATIYPYEEKSMGVMTNFFNKDEKGETLRQGLNKRQNIYALRGTIYDALAAFDYLVNKRRVDTIYWFGDFTDAIDESISTTLTNKLVSEGVKVIAHNFQGRPVGPLVEKMAKKTGGRTIEVVPGGKK